MPDFLILSHAADETAGAVAAALARRHGPGAVLLLSMEQLLLAGSWSHRLADGRATSHLRLAPGPTLASDGIGVVFNRLRQVSVPHFRRATDRDYAAMELFALLLSWLASLPCAVVNPPSPRGLAGAERSPLEWLGLAARCGLPTRATRLTTNARAFARVGFERCGNLAGRSLPSPRGLRAGGGVPAAELLRREVAIPPGPRPALYREPVGPDRRRVLMVGDRVLGAPSPWWAEACRRLAARSGCPLLEVVLVSTTRRPDDWAVQEAGAFPHLSGGEAVGAIVELLEARVAGSGARRS